MGVELLRSGNPLWGVVVFPIVVSVGMMIVLRLALEQDDESLDNGERRTLNGMLNVRTQSWSYLFGNTIAIPFALLCTAQARTDVSFGGWWQSVWWVYSAMAIGLMAGIAFHVAESGSFKKRNAEAALVSPTKIWYDYVVYPVLVGVTVWSYVPLVATQVWTDWTLAATGGIALWVILAIIDVIRAPDPLAMHLLWNKVRFCVIMRVS